MSDITRIEIGRSQQSRAYFTGSLFSLGVMRRDEPLWLTLLAVERPDSVLLYAQHLQPV